MSHRFFALACAGATLLTSLNTLADTCLNENKERYASNDARSFDYGKCKSNTPTDTYGSLSTLGMQLQKMMDKPADSDGHRQMSDAERARLSEWSRNRFNNLKYVMAHEVISSSMRADVGVYANAQTTPAQQTARREEISKAIQQGKLLDYDDGSYAKPWVSSSDPVKNWKTCEVSTQLIRAYTFGDFVTAEQKDPAKGFAIARSACDAHCGGACFQLGRIYEGGNKVAPGVDKVLGHEPQKLMLQAYDNAILNGVTAAYEREASLNWQPPARYADKSYFSFSDMESFDYWYDIQDYHRLAYAQYKRCLQVDPANLACARGINALIKETQKHSFVWSDLAKDIETDNKVAWYQDYQTKLEALYKAQAPLTAQ
jgi:hypothetical protein